MENIGEYTRFEPLKIKTIETNSKRWVPWNVANWQKKAEKDLPNNSFTASYPYLIWKVGVIVTLSVETLTMYLQAMPWTPAPSANVWTTTAASVEAEWKPFVFRRRSRRSHWYLLCLLH